MSRFDPKSVRAIARERETRRQVQHVGPRRTQPVLFVILLLLLLVLLLRLTQSIETFQRQEGVWSTNRSHSSLSLYSQAINVCHISIRRKNRRQEEKKWPENKNKKSEELTSGWWYSNGCNAYEWQ